jgi:hypothetical protein
MSDTIAKKVKTRKTHMCWGCCDTISYGSEVKRVTCFHDGTVTSTDYCDWCEKVFAKTPSHFYDDGIGAGELEEWFNEYPEYYKGIEVKESTND